MRNQRDRSPVGIILISAIITLLVLSAFSYVFVRQLVPRFALSSETIYFVLIRLLPISIGLVLVLIAIVIAPPRVPKDADEADMIERDEFTSPLFTLPVEEETTPPAHATMPVEPLSEAVGVPAPAQGLDRKPEQIKEFAGKQPMPVQIDALEVPKDLLPPDEESPERFALVEEADKPPEIPSDALSGERPSSDIAGRLSRAVLFSEYPYPIAQGSEIAKLLEPIGESEDEVSLPHEYMEVIEDTFDERLSEELEFARQVGYDISVAMISIPPGDSDPHAVEATVVQSLFNKLGTVAFFYLTDTNQVSAIMPFHGLEQSRRYFASLLESLRKQYQKTALSVGFSAVGERIVTADKLVHEAQLALEVASERTGYNLIAYDEQLASDTDS